MGMFDSEQEYGNGSKPVNQGCVLVEIEDANGDHVITVGPFENVAAAVDFTDQHKDGQRKGRWYFNIMRPKISPEALDWAPQTDLYDLLDRRGL